MSGEDIKAIQCDEKGKVVNFLMNDKCAAGTGRGMEVFADLLGVPITEIGDRSFDFKGKNPRRSRALRRLRKIRSHRPVSKGLDKGGSLAAYCRAMAERIYSLLERVACKPRFAATGGMAKNRGVMDRIMPMIGMDR